MKRILFLSLVVLLLAMSSAALAYTPGAYEGTTQGFGGVVIANVTVDEKAVTSVVLTGEGETPAVGGAALPVLAEQILAANGNEIDGVAGATITTDAVKNAVAAALTAARGETLDELSFIPGAYTGTAQGMWLPVTVEVVVSDKAIESVTVISQEDTPIIAEAAVREVPGRIVREQSLVVDVASGATITSNAILSATKDALKDATENMTALFVPTEEKKTVQLPDESYDIVIVGAGGAGLSAAVEAARSGKYSVLLLEKESWVGGSTALSGGGITVLHTEKNQGIGLDFVVSRDGQPMDCDPEDLLDYYKRTTQALEKRPKDMWINEELVLRTFEHSPVCYGYLLENGIGDYQRMGIPAKTPEELGIPGKGVMGVAAFGIPYAAGEIFGRWFTNLAEENGAEIRVNARVTDLVVNDGAVEGVVVSSPDGEYIVHAKKVILTTGGYANNKDLLVETEKEYFQYIENVWPFCAPGCEGDALAFTQDLDAATTGYGLMLQFGIAEPYAFETTLGDPLQITFLYVDNTGARFVDEMDWYYNKLDKAVDLEDARCYAIVDSTFPFSPKHGENMDFDDWMSILIEKGWAFKGETVEELASVMNMDAKNLRKSIDEHAERVAQMPTDRFGTTIHGVSADGPVYAIQMEMAVLDTMFGLKQDAQFRVLNTKDEPIPNLYAAGWVGAGNYMLQKYYCTNNAIAIAVYGGSLASSEAIAAIEAESVQ